MLPDLNRTIVALASGAQGARRAIVRLAGPATAEILRGLCTMPTVQAGRCAPQPELLSPDRACSTAHAPNRLPAEIDSAERLSWGDGVVWLPEIGRCLEVTLLFWPDHRSYTGSPAAEIHLLGSLPLAQALIDRCTELGAVPAERGEFTLRAFLAGKLDLAQAEAVLGVIQADSEETLATALAQLGGNLAPAIAPLREALLGVLAELEAGLDFVDEDIQFIEPEQLLGQLQAAAAQLQQFQQRLVTRSSTDVAAKVVLAGLPNSGKSTLFNALSGTELAIVADIAGTTRDYLQQRITSGNQTFDLIDTAGWEDLHDHSPRALAQQQLQHCLREAQLGLLCIDTSSTTDWSSVWDRLRQIPSKCDQWLVVGTKCDWATEAGWQCVRAAQRQLLQAAPPLGTSVNDVASINRLRDAIAQTLLQQQREQMIDPLALVHETAMRCRAALQSAQHALHEAIGLVEIGGGDELIAAELRLVLDELATLIGQIHSDDVLGEIFSRFCIGK